MSKNIFFYFIFKNLFLEQLNGKMQLMKIQNLKMEQIYLVYLFKIKLS